MRITIDDDHTNPIYWAWRILRGIYYCKKWPDTIRRTERGIHLIWYNIDCDVKRMFLLRKIIGDDKARIIKDIASTKRITQVLFKDKITTCYGYMHPVWFRIMHTKSKSPFFNLCPICNKKIKKAQKVWTQEAKEIRIFHKDTICTFKLQRRLF